MILFENVQSPLITSPSLHDDPVPIDSEILLLEAARKMNKGVLVRIFDLYSRSLYNYAMRLCGDPLTADQIVGDVFAKFLEHLAAGGGPRTNLRAYLYEMTYHCIIDEVRYGNRRAPLEVLETQISEDTAFLHVEDRLDFDRIMQVIRNELTDDQRHVIILRFLESMSLKETAAIVGKHVNHVKVIQNRAIQTLRRNLEGRELVSLNTAREF